jgi:hypothetical protein
VGQHVLRRRRPPTLSLLREPDQCACQLL